MQLMAALETEVQFCASLPIRTPTCAGDKNARMKGWTVAPIKPHGIAELLTNASRFPSGDHDGTLIVP